MRAGELDGAEQLGLALDLATLRRERDEAAVLGESISDEFDVESLLETDETLAFRRRGIGPDVVRKLRRGVWALQAQLES